METVEPKDIIIHIDGKTFYCEDCGCNVFRQVLDDERPEVLLYQCNGCRTVWVGEE